MIHFPYVNNITGISQLNDRKDEHDEEYNPFHSRIIIHSLFEDIFDHDQLDLFWQIALLEHTDTQLQCQYATEIVLEYLTQQNEMAHQCELEQATRQQQSNNTDQQNISHPPSNNGSTTEDNHNTQQPKSPSQHPPKIHTNNTTTGFIPNESDRRSNIGNPHSCRSIDQEVLANFPR